MDNLMGLSLKQYLDNASDKEPNPGGGSVAAYVGGLGTALAIMVLNLSYGKKAYEDLDQNIKDQLEDLKDEYFEIIKELEVYVNEDAKSFNKVLEAFKLPKETEEEKEIRSNAIQEGYKYALEVPLNTARLANRALNKLEPFVEHGTVSAITDVGCAILFLASAIEAALFNVIINLKSIKDEEFCKQADDEVHELIANAHRLRDDYLERTYRRLD
ncbi:cyclodeaminase/cyclohydrolase family protein [Microaceticoccus formicicus]|uniref:cyclodeaminase/cyclohydrolase family protein n=1 Tax=Microaceticoccus formicicus TaxID=3118105 RepID=UPI003CD01937|nr:cyclodeaminase/cyclohydrolase family protein [Peptoniphilaceae bacterium AMB_02]